MSERDLVNALKRVSKVRKAADARGIAVEALAVYEKKRKRTDLLKRLEGLPSHKPLVSHGKHGESPSEIQARLYRESKAS